MNEILSIWRSPLDKVAQSEADALLNRQPRCSIGYGEDFSAMTIYNYGYYTSQTGATPGSALTAMFYAMNNPMSPAGVGGTAFIPQREYSVTAGIIGSSMEPPFTPSIQCNVVASGEGGLGDGHGASDFFHFVISPALLATGPSCFLYCSVTHTSGGQYFRGLAFEWESTIYPDICIYAGTWNCRAINCTFTDCPVAFDAPGLACGMEGCTLQYNSGPNGNGPKGSSAFAAVVLGGSQCYVAGPGEYNQAPQSGTGAPADTCCISFESGLEHGVVRDLHINHWSYGITYAIHSHTTINQCMVTNVEFLSYTTCVYMEPSDSNGAIYSQKYASCTFALGDSSESPYSLVYINAAGGSINDVQFIACTAFQGNLHGYEINSGTNIQIIGGTSSGNGPSGGAGIALTGNSGACRFIGVNLDAAYPNAFNPLQNQQYAFLCSGSPAKPVLLDSCSMEGYLLGSPVSVTGTPAELLITNCAGYNDRNTSIAPTAPTSAATYAANASSITGGINYFGPSLIIFTNGAMSITFTTNSIPSTVPANAFVVYYIASPYDAIQFSGAPAHFAWLGK